MGLRHRQLQWVVIAALLAVLAVGSGGVRGRRADVKGAFVDVGCGGGSGGVGSEPARKRVSVATVWLSGGGVVRPSE